MITACGCVTLPDALILMAGETLACCDQHGYQPVVRRYSLREALRLPGADMLPDNPPF